MLSVRDRQRLEPPPSGGRRERRIRIEGRLELTGDERSEDLECVRGVGGEHECVLEVVPAGSDVRDVGMPARLGDGEARTQAAQLGQQLIPADGDGGAHRPTPAGCRRAGAAVRALLVRRARAAEAMVARRKSPIAVALSSPPQRAAVKLPARSPPTRRAR